MDKNNLPELFRQLQSAGSVTESDILTTPDGFRLIYKSLSDILSEKDIFDFPDSDGRRLLCSRFYDDWFLYAVPGERDHTCGLLKLREQEYDLEDGSPADGDTPGVTVSFISFAWEILLACLADPSDENRRKLDAEINRVVSRRGQRHHEDLKRYFLDPRSQGAYLVADLYTKHIAALAAEGYLKVPEQYKTQKTARLPAFIDELNRKAGYTLCDHRRICIRDPKHPTPYEAAAILATHTGNTSRHSFAAEVEYHARFLAPWAKIRIPFLGRSLYASAVRADMSVGDTEFQGPAPFYRETSKIVKRQAALHPGRESGGSL